MVISSTLDVHYKCRELLLLTYVNLVGDISPGSEIKVKDHDRI